MSSLKRKPDPYTWHPWWAWVPVIWDEGIAWFQWVERKASKGTWGPEWDYRWPQNDPGAKKQ